MLSSWQTRAILAVLGIGSILGAAAASAQSTTATQVLDRVNAVSPKAVLDMAFDDPAQPLPFETPPEITTSGGFTACQLTAKRGLFCLDQNLSGAPGRFVRRWDPVFKDGEVGNPYFSCESLPDVDTSKNVETCTGITADDNGAVVVAGKRKGGYNLIKVAPKADLQNQTCASPWAPLATTDLCYKVLLPRDRPLLVDVTYAELTFPNNVKCTGIIGLENRTTLMFFTDVDSTKNDPACAIDYAERVIADARAWKLDRGEVLQGATTVRTKSGDTFALVVSNSGKVRAEKVNDALAVPFLVPIFRAHTGETRAAYTSVAELRDGRTSGDGTPATRCDSTAQKFGIRTSTKSGRLYVTDKNYCEASAFEPTGDTLVADKASFQGLQVVEFAGSDLVLATTTQPSGAAYPTLEPTLAPGISIDLSKCAGDTGCTLVAKGDGQRIAVLNNVKVVSKSKGMILFQIRDLPDCRWIPVADRPAVCATDENKDGKPDAVDGDGPPQTQYLNIKPLLPKEVTDQFPQTGLGALPDMYISPQYRAQSGVDKFGVPLPKPFYFEAFFGVTQTGGVSQEGVVFQDVFGLEFFVSDLTESRKELGCLRSPLVPPTVANLLRFDIAVTVSEKVDVVGPKPFSEILVNNGCGSTAGGGARWSIYPYNLELTQEVYAHSPASNAKNPPDDYFAHVVVDLFYELEDTRELKACQTGGPLSSVSSVCSNLKSTWDNAKDKLGKCLLDSNYPRNSEAVRNCNSFDSQMKNYRNSLDAVPLCTDAATCKDPQNRLGELKVRVDTIRFIMTDRLIPSVPPDGFRYPAFEYVDPQGVLSRPPSL
jgi:hypothetical protein